MKEWREGRPSPFDLVKEFLEERHSPENAFLILDLWLSLDVWLPVLHEWRCEFILQAPDYLYLRTHKPELYKELQRTEDKMVSFKGGRGIEDIANIMRKWRELVLQAYFERQRSEVGILKVEKRKTMTSA